MAALRIIILGGGFGGVKCAKALRKLLRPGDAEIVLFNKENHLVFSPLLADAVGSSLNLQDVVVPLRQLLPGVECRTEEVTAIDLGASRVGFGGGDDCGPNTLDYDHLVIAGGNVSNLNVVPGMADHAFPLKTVGDAAVLRTHVLEQLERAEVCDDDERRRWHLSFIVVGGGYSGVEVAGEINDLVRGSRKFYRNIRLEDVQVTLIHSREQLLPEISPSLRDFAREEMEHAGVTMRLNSRVLYATREGVGLKDDFIRGGTIVCTIGSTTAPVIERLDTLKNKGGIITEPDMRLHGRVNAWAIGDCASIVNAEDGQPSPPTGQFAERQGRQCAENIVRVIHGEPTRPFSFKVLGQLCSIGGHSAVAELFGLKLSGFLAWFTWRGVYLFKLPDWSRRIQVGFDWAWLLLFPRDLSHIRTDPTDRVTHAHYEAGDFILRQGETPTSFYVIEKGEVEVLRATSDKPAGEVIATLGAGNFFGEQALLSNQPRTASVRARTPVEVVVLGRNVFTRIAQLAPLKLALTRALTSRAASFWAKRPDAVRVLNELKLADFIEPPPAPLLKPSDTLLEVMRVFARNNPDFFYVSADGVALDGVVTLTDLLRAQGQGLAAEAPVTDFMSKTPVSLAAADGAMVAASAFREHGFKYLPVVDDHQSRRLVGFVRARKLMAAVMQQVATEHG